MRKIKSEPKERKKKILSVDAVGRRIEIDQLLRKNDKSLGNWRFDALSRFSEIKLLYQILLEI